METRRAFLRQASIALLFIPVGAACSAGSNASPAGSSGSCDGVGATSSVAAGHTHTVCVDAADLANPPAQGMTFTTSVTDDHTHTVTLTAAQLQSIQSGGQVTVPTSTNAGHSHTFMLVKMA